MKAAYFPESTYLCRGFIVALQQDTLCAVVISGAVVAEAQYFKNEDLQKICPVLEVAGDCYSTSRVSLLISQLPSLLFDKVLKSKVELFWLHVI